MYQLTVEAEPATESQHPSWAAAHTALVRYATIHDVYLSENSTSPGRSSYTLVKVCDDSRRNPAARAVGQAVITAAGGGPAVHAAYYSASAAWSWVHDLPAVPAAVRAAVQLTRDGGDGYQLMREALDLPAFAGTPETLNIPPQLREAALLDRLPASPAGLAATVEVLMPNTATPQQTAAAIWWYALTTWGATA